MASTAATPAHRIPCRIGLPLQTESWSADWPRPRRRLIRKSASGASRRSPLAWPVRGRYSRPPPRAADVLAAGRAGSHASLPGRRCPPTIDRNFRLARDVLPHRYQATLTLDVPGRRFTGEGQLAVQVGPAGARLRPPRGGPRRLPGRAAPERGAGPAGTAHRPAAERDGAAGVRVRGPRRRGGAAPRVERQIHRGAPRACTWPARWWPRSSRPPTPAGSFPASTSRPSSAAGPSRCGSRRRWWR